ncbi:MAG: hypothetical protein PVG78_11435 [Desulfobacterales bacterium]|jgi:hypothetical protein
MNPTASKTVRNRIALSLFLLIVGVLAATAALDALMTHTPLDAFDQNGRRYYGETLKRAAVTYAVVRGLNGVISVIQGSTVEASPAGVGLSAAVGEILDPVNDLMERFSWVLLLSTASLGIQKILMDLGAGIGLRIFLPAAMALLLAGLWGRGRSARFSRAVGMRLLLLALAVRFALPAAAAVGDAVYAHFLEETYLESSRNLETLSSEVNRTAVLAESPLDKEEPPGWFDRLLPDTQLLSKIRSRVEAIREQISEYAHHTLNLIVVFLFQTVLLPLIVLWGILRPIFSLNLQGDVLYEQ